MFAEVLMLDKASSLVIKGYLTKTAQLYRSLLVETKFCDKEKNNREAAGYPGYPLGSMPIYCRTKG